MGIENRSRLLRTDPEHWEELVGVSFLGQIRGARHQTYVHFRAALTLRNENGAC